MKTADKLQELKQRASIVRTDKMLRHVTDDHDIVLCHENVLLMQASQEKAMNAVL